MLPTDPRFADRLQRHLERSTSPEVAVARVLGGRIVRPQNRHRLPMQLLAYLSHERGTSYAKIARSYGIHASTAVEWVKAGRQAWEADPAGCRKLLATTYGETLAADYAGPAPDGPVAA